MRRRVPQAIRNGDLGALKQLLAEDPSAYRLRTEQGHSFVLLALYYGRTDMAEILRGDGTHLDLCEAAALGDEAAVLRHLASDPGSVNTPAPDGRTPLALARQYGHAGIVQALLRAGAREAAPG